MNEYIYIYIYDLRAVSCDCLSAVERIGEVRVDGRVRQSTDSACVPAVLKKRKQHT